LKKVIAFFSHAHTRMRRQLFFSHQTHHAQGNGKNRENRLQLRCGNASDQTITRALKTRAKSQLILIFPQPAKSAKAMARQGRFRNQKISHTPRHMRSPNIHPWALTRPARNFCARRNREIFIAKMKRESSSER